ncbi:ATP-binding protein [Motiliproteus coralliicola]|uniref:ATP-binding protein n=1 Tax=Motiliproteus coralliicola TaxID=2283196 RepID=A0A369WRE7_9GAMM|nr:ATP-binding protein [Motiliproteus coralliicola]RDE24688.1 ATP-binding protein [Motiliproteus coralliicola]
MDAATDTRELVNRAELNAKALEQELHWLAQVLEARLEAYFYSDGEPMHFRFDKLPPPSLPSDSNLARLIERHQLEPAQRLILALVITPYVRPQMLDVLFARNKFTERGYTEFGGLQSQGHGGFLPSIETALFLLAGDALEERFKVNPFLESGSELYHRGLIQSHSLGPLEPWTSAALTMPKDIQDHLTTGNPFKPAFNADFPARKISTKRRWEQLILPQAILSQLQEIADWVKYSDVLMNDWQMEDRLTPGYTALFHGPPGTGKTLSACLLGQFCRRELYKIDLSLMVSKYIGETEKNLARIFDTAEHKEWILFFDEADALFGKRTQVDDSRDRYANQEVSYLLQRIEDFHGVVILASNLKANIDDAFIRRFQTIIPFPMPAASERLRIWQQAFSSKVEFDPEVDLGLIAEHYEVSGGTIMNVVRHCSLRAISRQSTRISQDDIEQGLKREFAKQGRRI